MLVKRISMEVTQVRKAGEKRPGKKKGENVGAGTKVASSVAVEREVAVII